jgi:hypothetical protein
MVAEVTADTVLQNFEVTFCAILDVAGESSGVTVPDYPMAN